VSVVLVFVLEGFVFLGSVFEERWYCELPVHEERVCGGCVDAAGDCVDAAEKKNVWRESKMWRRGMLAMKNKASRAARSKILLLGVQGI